MAKRQGFCCARTLARGAPRPESWTMSVTTPLMYACLSAASYTRCLGEPWRWTVWARNTDPAPLRWDRITRPICGESRPTPSVACQDLRARGVGARESPQNYAAAGFQPKWQATRKNRMCLHTDHVRLLECGGILQRAPRQTKRLPRTAGFEIPVPAPHLAGRVGNTSLPGERGRGRGRRRAEDSAEGGCVGPGVARDHLQRSLLAQSRQPSCGMAAKANRAVRGGGGESTVQPRRFRQGKAPPRAGGLRVRACCVATAGGGRELRAARTRLNVSRKLLRVLKRPLGARPWCGSVQPLKNDNARLSRAPATHSRRQLQPVCSGGQPKINQERVPL